MINHYGLDEMDLARDAMIWQDEQRERAPKPVSASPRFANVSCSQCGMEFGPGEHGYSHCSNHRPKPQPCHACEAKFAGAVCPICKTERPAYTALKAMTARERGQVPQCRYFKHRPCECGGRGVCIPAA